MSTSSQNEASEASAPSRRSRYEDVPPQRYEVTWLSGHVETVIAHQVSWPNAAANLFGRGEQRPSRIQCHAEVDGQWTLQLSALEGDLRTVRNVTNGEQITSDGGAL